jgi:hypothetical protein
MMLTTLLIAILILILTLLGTALTLPHSRAWGWGPGGTVGVTLIGLLILLLTGLI